MVKVQQRGLGRGLSALMGDTDIATPAKTNQTQAREIIVGQEAGQGAGIAGGIQNVSLSKLVANQYQPREVFDEEHLEELSASIRQHGVMQPIVVRPSKLFKGSFEIIAGERRFRASKRAGLETVPVIVREFTDSEALELAIIENIQRQDLNALEEAQGYQRLLEEFDYTQEALAKTIGKSRSHVANLLRVLSLPEAVKQQLASGALTLGHAKTLLTSKNPESLAAEIVSRGLSVRQAEALAKEVKDTPDISRAQRGTKSANRGANPAGGNAGAAAQREKDPDIVALEDTLTENLGLVVNINDRGGQKGEIVICYESLTQLDGVLRRLGGGV